PITSLVPSVILPSPPSLPVAPALLRSPVFLVLPSFPTRRSSDLRCARLRRNCRISIITASTEQMRTTGKSDQYRGIFYESKTDKDRKSTRLNSSHVSISYAVFCLKKKRKTPLPGKPDNLSDTAVV